MSKFGKKIEDLLNAASFAEEGEPAIAREMIGSRKKVLLVMTGRPSDDRPLKYAINMALRNNAAIEALVVAQDGDASTAIQLLNKETAGKEIHVSVSHGSGCIKESLVSHARKRSDVLCVVAESEEILEIDCSRKYKKLEGVWRELTCPLTLVSEKGGA